MRLLLALACGIALLAPTLASAHDTLPADWCQDPNTTAVVVAKFRITPFQLSEFRRNALLADPGSAEVCNEEKSCGIVDEWFWANAMAQQTCHVAAKDSQAFVSEPGDFNLTGDADGNGIADHHDNYRFKDGDLVGVCVACRYDAPVLLDNSATR